VSDIRLGVVTFGRSGEAGLAEDLQRCLPGCTIDEVGLLDDVDASDIQRWQADGDTSDVTVVHLGDGQELTLQSEPLMDGVPAALDRLAKARPDAVLFGCAGPLPNFAVAASTINPFRLLHGFLDALLPAGRVGIVVPSPLHVDGTQASYATATRDVACRAASPADRHAVAAALADLSEEGVGLLVLACFDHTLEDLATARRAGPCPVVSTRVLAVMAIAALFGLPQVR
jgi:protein AroM